LLLAWLWHRGCGSSAVGTSKAELAFELGGSERAVDRWLAQLTEVGMVRVVDRDKGCLTLRVCDSDDAESCRRNRRGTAAGPPRASIDVGSAALGSKVDRPSMSTSDFHDRRYVKDARREAQPAQALPIGSALSEVLARVDRGPDLDFRARQVEQLVAWIQSSIEDPKLRRSPCLRAATAVVTGSSFDAGELQRMLDYCRRARNPGAAFVVSLKRRFRELGLPYSTRGKSDGSQERA